jgi:hypothetical protein
MDNETINKKTIGIYANCQGVIALKYYLKRLFPDWIIVNMKNYCYIKDKIIINYPQLKKFDIFIYQPLGKQHGIYSTSTKIKGSIINMLDEKCIKISFPYIYNDALWPLTLKEWDSNATPDNKNIHGKGINGYHNSKIIFDLLKKKSKKNIKSLFLNNKIDFKFGERFKNTMEKLIEKERTCDIKITDFILQNYKKQKLFLTKNHPTSCIFKVIVEQILNILNIQRSLDIFDFANNDLCKLRGNQPHSEYEVNFFGFEYDVNINNNYYLNIIESIDQEN